MKFPLMLELFNLDKYKDRNKIQMMRVLHV